MTPLAALSENGYKKQPGCRGRRRLMRAHKWPKFLVVAKQLQARVWGGRAPHACEERGGAFDCWARSLSHEGEQAMTEWEYIKINLNELPRRTEDIELLNVLIWG